MLDLLKFIDLSLHAVKLLNVVALGLGLKDVLHKTVPAIKHGAPEISEKWGKKNLNQDQNQMALRHWVARSGASGANTQIYFSKSVNIFRLTQKKNKKIKNVLDSKVQGWLPGD